MDYQNPTGSPLSWADQDSASKTFTIPMCNDSTIEAAIENTSIVLGTPTGGATLGSPNTATLSINDDEERIGHSPYFDTLAGTADTPDCSFADGTGLTIYGVQVNRLNSRKLVCALGAESVHTAGDLNCDFTDAGVSVAWGASAMTLAAADTGLRTGSTTGTCAGVFYLDAAAAETRNVVVTWPSTVTDAHGACFTIYEVAPGAPTNVYTTASPDVTVQASNQTDTITTTIADTLIIDAMALGARNNGGNISTGAGLTERADLSCNADSHMGAGTAEAPTPGNYTLSWTWPAGGTAQTVARAMAAWTAYVPPTTTTTLTPLPTCGNGIVAAGEECDCLGACSAGELDNKDCADFAPYVAGTLACAADCLAFVTTGCTLNAAGETCKGRCKELCEVGTAPSCNGKCPTGERCVNLGSSCECR